MATRPKLLLAVLVTLAVYSSASSAAKCYYTKPKASVAPTTTPTVQDGGSDTPTMTEAPTVVEAEADGTTEAPTETADTAQFTTPVPVTASSDAGQGSSFPSQTSIEESAEMSNAGQESSFPSQSSAEESSGGVSQTASSATSGHATFGKITSQKGGCVVGNPETFISTADLDDQWDRCMSKYVPTFENLIFDHIVNNNASLSYCVRWDSTEKLSKSVESKFADMIAGQYKLWNHWLVGYDCWPFEKIDVKVVAFAVRDVSLLDWSDDSLGVIYEGTLDADGIPKCPDECNKHLNRAAKADTSAYKGEPFDMSLWPSTKVGDNINGAAGDWGQRVELTDMLATMDQDQMMVLAHEIGHGFGLPDFYEATDKSSTFPAAIMDQSYKFTDADGWMLRRVLENIKSRYDF